MKLNNVCFLLFFSFLLMYIPQFSLCDSDKRINVSCCDSNGEFRLNLIPHPTSCLAFYQCEPVFMPDGQYGTVPALTFCPLDENGKSQHYDFTQCKCMRDHEASCFDGLSREDREAFFNCTQPLIVEGTNSRCR